MVTVGDDDEVFSEQLDFGEFVGHHRPGQDGEIQLTVDHSWFKGGVRTFTDAQIDVRIALANVLEQQGDDPASRRTDHAQGDLTANLGVEFRDVRGDRAQLTEYSSGSFDHDHSRFGEGAGRAIDEWRAELALESGDSIRDI